MLDPSAVRDAIAQLTPSVVYHCAGAADVGTSWADPVTPLAVNALGTHHLLEAVRLAGLDTTVVLAGSAAIYRASDGPLDEQSPIGPSSPYGVSKLAQEMLGERATSFPVVLTRPFNHGGPGNRRRDVGFTDGSRNEAGIADPCWRGNLDAGRDTDVRTPCGLRLAERGARPTLRLCSGQLTHR
jgi:GDP-4-dehydro-6-deoxy-D-mannose reductase